MMKNQINLLITTGILFTLLTGCNQGKEQIATLETQVVEQQSQIIDINAQNENLITQVHNLEGQIETYENDIEAPVQISQSEREIRDLVVNLQKGWDLVPDENNKSALLQHFLTKYTTNGVSINTENLPTVRRHDHEIFEAHLDAISEIEGLSIKFGEPQFLYVEVKENIFATCYRSLMRVYDNGKLKSTASVVSLISGPKREEGWKVGNYNWVTFNYEK